MRGWGIDKPSLKSQYPLALSREGPGAAIFVKCFYPLFQKKFLFFLCFLLDFRITKWYNKGTKKQGELSYEKVY